MVAPADYTHDLKKYVPTPDEAAVRGIVRYLGIALRTVDSAHVAASDPGELRRLREGLLKKRLKLQEPDESLDAAVADVMQAMAGDHRKSRVTVYYLLAERFGRLQAFA